MTVDTQNQFVVDDGRADVDEAPALVHSFEGDGEMTVSTPSGLRLEFRIRDGVLSMTQTFGDKSGNFSIQMVGGGRSAGVDLWGVKVISVKTPTLRWGFVPASTIGELTHGEVMMAFGMWVPFSMRERG